MARLKAKRSFRLASYNIRKAKGLDRVYNPMRILDVINGLGADMVVLQEADHRLGNRPTALPRRAIETETDFNVLDVAGHESSLGWHGNAVLIRKDVAARKPRQITLPGLEPRGAVEFQTDLAPGVTLVGTHLGLMRRHRQKQLAALADRLSETRNAILVGDFNEWSPVRGFAPISDRFSILSPGRSFHAARPIAALDRIAHTQGLEITNAGVQDTTLTRRASDHLPIWADIKVETAA